ncbi:4'-phosphopantetheinyl transferase family protein [Sulfurimonas sp.]|uniref:4'-phosphopantetheinyl transferase family protein n=1 Tax=Sulfurimonas sp. TaxID=2022749 RepID=UPI002AB1ED4B|nr:4'-phosphopantetheinyl transferase superfamily protein [Sulfurimonas sp.]
MNALEKVYSDENYEIFVFAIEQNSSMVDTSIIPNEQLDKIQKYKQDIDKIKRYLARTFLFEHCAKKYGLKDFSFIYTNKKRPKFKHSKVDFSISYSKNLIAVALSTNATVGVDIEFMEPSIVSKSIAAEFMNTIQLSKFNTLTKKDRDNYFYKMWTSKESLLKAMGDGLYINPKTVTNEIGDFFYFKDYIISFTKTNLRNTNHG